ncbi:sugar transferase [Seleniivibrio sp.]|uniref:sugar transferase n=1 Tax=Seleniivibrio sp. TaxID=2898801 RepID=UPI0025F99469|nr:sugar transferase [Seleniivibrio sp.]MCD8554963.1 sugar transferase [Seleniivibrio sp.]
MICLGRKYIFNEYELKVIEKLCPEFSIIDYNEKEPNSVIEEIDERLSKSAIRIVILNTEHKVDNNIISYLVNHKNQPCRQRIKIITLEHFMEMYLKKCLIPDDNISLDYLDNIRSYTFKQYITKRLIDYFFCLIIFTFGALFIGVIAFIIKKQSSGKLFFKQTRVGLNGKLFQCYKFRSMHENMEYDPYTRKEDPRIFPFGKFMRKARIDEFPQIINVFKGDMHMIGPRAEWNVLVNEYEKVLPYYNERHIVAPGITGWAQVNYPYGASIQDTKQKLMYDLFFIKHWSIKLELLIIWRTMITIFKLKGR